MLIEIYGERYNIAEWFEEKLDFHKVLEVVSETDKAYLLRVSNLRGEEDIWIPKSVLNKINMEGQMRLW